MRDFYYYCPTRFEVGKQKEKQIGKYLNGYNVHKALLVYYGSNADYEKKLIADVKKSLDEHGIQYVDFYGVKPNPQYEDCDRAGKLAKSENVDFVLAVGGGSVIDTAKYVSIDFYYEGDTFEDHYVKHMPVGKTLPVGVISTLAGTGSEGSWGSVVTKGENKASCMDDAIRPVLAILDPELTYTLPVKQTVSGAVDAMCHVFTRYWSTDTDNYIKDEMSEAVLRSVIHYLPIAIEDPYNYEARSGLFWATIVAHNDILGTFMGQDKYGMDHAFQGPIGGKYNTIHGLGCACAAIALSKYLYKKCPERSERYFHNVWHEEIDPFNREAMILRGIKRQEEFFASVGVPIHAAELGLKKEDIPELADQFRYDKDGYANAALKLTRDDIIAIYELML